MKTIKSPLGWIFKIGYAVMINFEICNNKISKNKRGVLIALKHLADLSRGAYSIYLLVFKLEETTTAPSNNKN